MKNLIKLKHLLLTGACLATIAVPAAAERYQSERHDFEAQLVTDQLTRPWGMAFLPGGGMLITEKAGRLRLLDAEGLRPAPIAGLPEVHDGGQGGLLGLALDPGFADNRRVYLAYSAGGPLDGYGTEVIRGELRGPALVNVETIFVAQPKRLGNSRHFGARLVFGNDGALFISLGDRGKRTPAQDLTSHHGSLIRVNPDGSPPPDNPFITTPGARPEIYTYGNRNMQGLAFQPGAGLLWSHEHGPQGGDELNVMRPGVNYGWPVITYGVNYGIGTKIGEGTEKSGMAQPVHVWTPSIAPSGMAFYTGEDFPHWRGNLFVGSLAFGQLARLELQGEAVAHEERLFNYEFGRIRDVKQGPEGFLYFLTDEEDGKLYRLIP